MSRLRRFLATLGVTLAALAAGPVGAAPRSPGGAPPVAAPAASSTAAAPAPTPAQIHRATDEVLSQGKYRLKPSPVQAWLEKAFAALVRLLERLLGHLGESRLMAVGAEAIFYTLTAVVVLAALGLLVRFLLGRRQGRAAPKPAASPRSGRVASPGDLQAQAAALAARGQYGAALRLLQQACLLALDRRGLLAVRSSSTNGEYLRQLRAHPAPRALLAELLALVEVHLYGGRALDEAQYRQGEHSARALLQGATGE